MGKFLRLFLFLGAFSLLFSCSAEEEPIPAPAPVVDRLAPPALPDDPSQADLGHEVYYQICMACHGDRGQGLTEDWRAVWDEDYNCWKSGCHGPDHPPWGFEMEEDPSRMVAVIGPGTLGRFQNAQELYTYIHSTMPWWNPGSLTVDQSWQVTAYLMRENGALPDNFYLGPENAAAYPVHPVSPQKQEPSALLIVVSTLTMIVGLLFLLWRRTK